MRAVRVTQIFTVIHRNMNKNQRLPQERAVVFPLQNHRK